MREGNKGEFIFIGGTGRSGTTILSKVLNTHKEFNRLPFELRLHTDPRGLYDLYRGLVSDWDVFKGATSVDDFKKFYDKLLGHSLSSYQTTSLKSNSKTYYQNILVDFFNGLEIVKEKRLWTGNSPYLTKKLSSIAPKYVRSVYPDFYLTRHTKNEKFYRLTEIFFKSIFHVELQNSIYLIEHTPYNFLYFDFLNDIFPNSKFIHIKRNPLDIISSYSIQDWGSNDINLNAMQIVDLYKRWKLKKPSLNNFLEISLEELGNNTDTTLNKIAEYLGTEVVEFQKHNIDTNRLHFNRWKEKEELFKKLPIYKELKECAQYMGYVVD